MTTIDITQEHKVIATKIAKGLHGMNRDLPFKSIQSMALTALWESLRQNIDDKLLAGATWNKTLEAIKKEKNIQPSRKNELLAEIVALDNTITENFAKQDTQVEPEIDCDLKYSWIKESGLTEEEIFTIIVLDQVVFQDRGQTESLFSSKKMKHFGREFEDDQQTYGVNPGIRWTIKHVADKLNCSEHKVSKLKKSATEKMKAFMEDGTKP